MERQRRKVLSRGIRAVMSRHHISLNNGLFLAVLFSGIFCVRPYINSDAWFMLACGRYIEEFGIPHADPLTFLPNIHLVMQQSLFATFLWKLYSAFGLGGLHVYSYVSCFLIILAEAAVIWHVSEKNRDTTEAIALPVGYFVGAAFATQRPWTLTLALLLFEVFLLELFRSSTPRWLPAAFFLVSVLCVNIESAMWPMTIVFLLPYMADAVFRDRLPMLPKEDGWTLRRLGILILAVLVGGLLNPYGWEGMQYGLLTYGKPSIVEIITEMFPLRFSFISGNFFLLDAAMIAIFALVVFYARHPVPLRLLLLAAGTAFMALLAARNIIFFMTFAPIGVAWVLKDWKREPHDSRLTLIVAAVLAVLLPASSYDVILESIEKAPAAACFYLAVPLAVAAISFRRSQLACIVFLVVFACSPILLSSAVRPSVDAGLEESVQTIKKDNQDAKMRSDYVDAGYAEFHGLHCLFDARAEVFLKETSWQKDFLKEHTDMVKGATYYKDYLDKYPEITHVLTHGENLLYVYLLHDPDYELVYDSAGRFSSDEEEYRVFRKKS